MEQLLPDLWANLQTYYDGLIDFLPRFIIAVGIFLLFYFIAGRIRAGVAKGLVRRMDDPLLARFLARMVRIVILIVVLLFVLKILGLGTIAGGLLASAGVGAFIIGFAFKDIGENFLAGIMLAFNRPFKVGDIVELEGIQGKVVALTLRTVQIKTYDGRDVFIPNASIIKKAVVNYTVDGLLRYDFVIGLDYGSDVPRASDIIQRALREVSGILQEGNPPVVAVADLTPSTLNLKVFYWIDAFDPALSALQIKTTAVTKVLDALNAEGYYLPGDVMEIRNYRDTGLKALPTSEDS